MAWSNTIQSLSRSAWYLLSSPRESVRHLAAMRELHRAGEVARGWRTAAPASAASVAPPTSRLHAYADALTEGPGVLKWQHYFEMYDRHLQKFVGRDVTLVEVGVWSGGSMPMWHHYLGDRCHVHGIDIEEDCRAYATANTTIHIGDQSDRAFWKQFRASVPRVDVFIDDGGHEPEQQMVTLEEMLPHLSDGGVFICEDVHAIDNRFARFAQAIADDLNAYQPTTVPELSSAVTPFQAAIKAVHFYPYAVVIEKNDAVVPRFEALKRGTQWRPIPVSRQA